MKYPFPFFCILILHCSSLSAQPPTDFKRNEIGIGTSWFPAYLFIATEAIDSYGLIGSYQYKITRNFGLRLGVIYNSRIGINNASKLNDKGYFIGTHAGFVRNIFVHKRWTMFGAIDIFYAFAKNDLRAYQPYSTGYKNKYYAGLGVGTNFKITPSFYLEMEFNWGYAYNHYKNVREDGTTSTDTYSEMDALKIFGTQLIYKF